MAKKNMPKFENVTTPLPSDKLTRYQYLYIKPISFHLILYHQFTDFLLFLVLYLLQCGFKGKQISKNEQKVAISQTSVCDFYEASLTKIVSFSQFSVFKKIGILWKYSF